MASLTQYLQELRNRLIKSHYLIIILPVIFLILAVMLYAPFLFNNNDLRYQIEQKISSHTNSNLEIKGPVQVSLLPSPKITLNDAILRNLSHKNQTYHAHSQKIEIKLSFFASLIAKFSIKKLIFTNPTIEKQPKNEISDIKSPQLQKINTKLAKTRSQDGINGNLFSIKKLDLNKFNIKNLPDIEIRNLRYISYSKLENKTEIEHFNAKFDFSKKKITGIGTFKNRGLPHNFTLNLKPQSKDNDSTLNLTSTYANFKIYGSFFNESQPKFGDFFQGNFEGEIFSLKNLYKSYISGHGFIFDKLNPAAASIKIKSKFKKNENHIAFENILINSDLITGYGHIDIEHKQQIPIIDVKTSIEFLDLDAIWLGKAKKPIKIASKEPQTLREASLDITKDLRDFDLTFETKISQIRYLAEKIKNVDIYTTISKQGDIMLFPMTLETPGNVKIHISGTIQNRDNSPKFIGKIDAKGEKLADTMQWLKLGSQNLKYDKLGKYSLYGDILLMPNRTILNNIYLNINEQNSELLGEMRIDYHNHSANIISNFEIHNFDLNDYFLDISQNIYFSPGDLLKKLLWLNQIESKNDLTLTFDKLSYKNQIFKSQKLKTRFGPGYFELDKLHLKSDNLDLNTSIAIDITGQKPQFNLTLKSDKFNLKNTPIINDKKVIPDAKNGHFNLIEQIFALPSLENFIGNIFFDLKELQINDFKLEKLKTKAKLRNGILDFSEFNGQIYGGGLAFNGSAAIKFEKSLSGNFTLTKTQIKPFLSDIFAIKNIDGIANISSSISSSGSKISEFATNINSNTKFKASNVKIEKYGLNSLIRHLFNPKYFKNELKTPLKTLYNPESSTKIKQASGLITINTGKENRFKTNFSGTAFNGVITGQTDLIKRTTQASTNIIFLTGTKTKQIPLNITNSINITPTNTKRHDNISQVEKYLEILKN